MELDGHVAIVTGASSEIGRAIVVALARDGAHLVLLGRNVEAKQPVAAAIASHGRLARVIRCDVTQSEQIAQMVTEVRSNFDDRIDILVNVAGGTAGLGVPIWDISASD